MQDIPIEHRTRKTSSVAKCTNHSANYLSLLPFYPKPILVLNCPRTNIVLMPIFSDIISAVLADPIIGHAGCAIDFRLPLKIICLPNVQLQRSSIGLLCLLFTLWAKSPIGVLHHNQIFDINTFLL